MIDFFSYIFFKICAIAIFILIGLMIFNILISVVAILGINFKNGKFWKSIAVIWIALFLYLFLVDYEKKHPGKPWVRPDYSEYDEYEDAPRCYGGNICD